MDTWIRRLRGAIGMGLAWGAVGGLLLSAGCAAGSLALARRAQDPDQLGRDAELPRAGT